MLGGSLNFEITIKFWFFDKIRNKELSNFCLSQKPQRIDDFHQRTSNSLVFFFIKKRE
jgi:hypothetical protein